MLFRADRRLIATDPKLFKRRYRFKIALREKRMLERLWSQCVANRRVLAVVVGRLLVGRRVLQISVDSGLCAVDRSTRRRNDGGPRVRGDSGVEVALLEETRRKPRGRAAPPI